MIDKKLKDLGIAAATGASLSAYSINAKDVDGAFREELNKMIGSKSLFRKNKYDAYELIEEVADIVVPSRVIEVLGDFTNVKTFDHNQKAVFKRKLGRNRAKSVFVTKAARAGVYETFRLDTEEFEVPVSVHGGAARISLQEILTGEINMAEMMDIITEGLVDATYAEVQAALMTSYTSTKRPTNTKFSGSAYDHQQFVNLINVVSAYGAPVVFTTKTFASYMRPVYGSVSTYMPNVSNAEIEELRKTGMLQIVHGAPVIALPQSYTDETNATTVINPRLAYIFPSDSQKVVNLAFEGGTHVSDYTNVDDSMEIKAHRKLGVAIINHNNWAICENKAIVDTSFAVLG